jgi:asparagine synthase (glutamine-hydrolysing)
MVASLARRGPDGEGMHFDGPVALGHRRLAIIDLSERSRQPMVDAATGLALVFNGTIYNYPQLRAELIGKGHTSTPTATPKSSCAPMRNGAKADCVARLHGAFAFAIWDRLAGSLFLARDRLGIKPLYFSLDGRQLRFASTPQACWRRRRSRHAIDPVKPCTTTSPCMPWCPRRAPC